MKYREIDYVLTMPWGEKFTFSVDELITRAMDINGHCIPIWRGGDNWRDKMVNDMLRIH
jgi:hypothetical protein